jgi:hypothetical protein
MNLDSINPRVGRERRDFGDVVEMLPLPDGEWVTVRIMETKKSKMFPYRKHWINILVKAKKEEGKKGKGTGDTRAVRIPKICVAFDPASDTGGPRKDKRGKKIHCSYCSIPDNQDEDGFLVNVIDRKTQEDGKPKNAGKPTKAELKSGFKDKNSDSWTPMRVLRVTAYLAFKLKGLKDLNKVKTDEGTKKVRISHPIYGRDVNIRYNSNGIGPDKYQVSLADSTKITEEEKGYLLWKLDDALLDLAGRETPEEAKKELAKMNLVGENMEDDEDDDDSVSLGSSKGKGKKGKNKAKDYDDEDEDSDSDDDEDDEDDEPKKSKKKGKDKVKPKGKKGKAEDDDDEDDDEDDEDDDDEDDDEDDDDEDDDDEDDDEDDDDEDDDDEDDEDDEPKKSKAKGKVKDKQKSKEKSKGKDKGKKSKKKSKDDDDDDDDDIPW